MTDCALLERSLAASLKRLAAELLVSEDDEEQMISISTISIIYKLASRYSEQCRDNRLIDEIDDIIEKAERGNKADRRELAEKTLILAHKLVHNRTTKD